MNEKITFFDDIIDIDTLVTMQLVSSPLIQNLPSHPNSKDYLYDWNLCPLDMTKLEKVILVRDIFLEMNLFKCFNIKEQVFIRFMWEIAYFYTKNKNPFHNFSHSVNVCHAGFYLLKTYPRFSNLLSMEQQFGFIVSCLGHDLDHRGKTNNFEIMTESDLALTYHDTSPLEYHHAAVLFKTLAIKGNNIMHTVKGEAWKSLKKDMLENILATDMKLHFSMLTQFKTQLLENSSFGENPCSDQERKLITNHFIHYCDLSGSFKDFAISTRWSKLVNMEFSNQVRTV